MSSCIKCGSPLKRNSKLYCSPECYSLHKSEINLDNIVKVLLDGRKFECKNQRSLKVAVIRINGHKCAICEKTEWMGKPIPLVLDHIDGRASNNVLSNLRLVCGNCDMQLPTYKSKNKNSDRNWRVNL